MTSSGDTDMSQNYEFTHRRLVNAVFTRLVDEVRRLLFESGVQRKFESGRMTEAEFHRWFEETMETSVTLSELRRAGSDIFELNEPMPAILEALRDQGIRTVLLSNTSVSHFEWVQAHFCVLEGFDDYVLSFEVGAVKPEPAIYEAALRTIDCEPAHCFYTDDISEYVAVARRFGLQAETFTGVDELQRHLQERGIEFE